MRWFRSSSSHSSSTGRFAVRDPFAFGRFLQDRLDQGAVRTIFAGVSQRFDDFSVMDELLRLGGCDLVHIFVFL